MSAKTNNEADLLFEIDQITPQSVHQKDEEEISSSPSKPREADQMSSGANQIMYPQPGDDFQLRQTAPKDFFGDSSFLQEEHISFIKQDQSQIEMDNFLMNNDHSFVKDIGLSRVEDNLKLLNK